MTHVYDKAKWHLDGDFPDDVPADNAFVYGGLFLAWAIERDLVSKAFREDNTDDIAAVRARQKTGPRLYRELDGALDAEMLSREGNAFAKAYFDDAYIDDFIDELTSDLPSVYHVADTWESFEAMCGVLDRRFAAWRRRVKKRAPAPKRTDSGRRRRVGD